MPIHTKSFLKAMPLAGLLASSMMICFAQTSTTPPAAKPAVKKPATAATAKTPAKAAAVAAPTTAKDKISYAIGADLANKLKASSIDVDRVMLTRGLNDVLSGGTTAMTDDEVRNTLMELSKGLQAKQQAVAKEAGDKNKKDGEAFLAENKSKEGVVVLPSGLQYKILKAGDGPKPTAADSVVCNYKGTLIGGKEFDSSYKRGQPATFPVGGVIKGWTEALQLMPVGSKWQLFIPPDLAYGDRQAGPDITPGSTLVFEVELVSIQAKNASAAPAAPAGDKAPETEKK
ncbi:MAG TPA: FKBP-type peptidyl-prolyl cis-trans isomerase [Terriglobales bacterium]|nr:FKBP-type peptidyl-prolyl cis-trans isomerase [Terriglobales bacterium]